MSEQAAVDALYRRRFDVFLERVFHQLVPGATFLPGWYLDAIIHELMRSYQGEITRSLICLPPRHLKSLTVSVAFPAWALGHDPTLRFICASYSPELAHDLSIKTKQVITADWYRQAFPATCLTPSPNTQSAFSTTAHGGRRAVTVGGALTGLGGNYLLIDDPHKADEVLSDAKREAVLHWYQNTALTRLDNPATDRVIVVMQRLHELDLAGFLMETHDWQATS